MADIEVRQADAPVSPRCRTVWPLVFFVLLAAVSLSLHLEKSRRQKRILAAKEQHAAMVRARPIEEAKSERARFYQIRYFLGYPMAASHAAAELVRHVDALIAPLRLRAVQIDLGLHDLGFELAVEVSGGGPRDVRRRLAVFLERLRHVPNITLADFSGPGPTTRGGGVRVFTVNGRAELQP